MDFKVVNPSGSLQDKALGVGGIKWVDPLDVSKC